MQDRWAPAVRAWRRAGRFHDEHAALVTAVAALILAIWVYWPILSDLKATTSSDRDVGLFVWSMEHAPWRLLHGRNPFFSSSIFATTGGANLAFSATSPALALLMSPTTAWLGPIASINVLTVLTPVLNTLAARRLLRIASGLNGASVTIGAAVIGFSPLVLMHDAGRFQLAFIAVALLVLAELWLLGASWLDGQEVSLRRFVWLGALAGLQTWIGSEMLAVTAIIASIAAVTALEMRRKARTLHVGRPTHADGLAVLAGIGTMLVVASPFLSAFLFGSERYTEPYHAPARHLFGLRVANLFTPTDVTLLDHHVPFAISRSALSVFPDEDTGYLSLAGVAILLLVAATWRRRSATQRGALILVVSCWLLALGPTIRWRGQGSGIPGPWRVLGAIPVVEEIVAARVSLGVFVGLGYLVASLAARPGRSESAVERPMADRALRFACCLLPVLMLPAQFDRTHVVSSAADDLLRDRCRGTLVVAAPREIEQEAMAWQARADFAFDLYRGFAFRASTPPKGDTLLLDELALTGPPNDDAITAAVDELGSLGIGCVVARSSDVGVIGNLTPVLGPPEVAGDVAVWPGP